MRNIYCLLYLLPDYLERGSLRLTGAIEKIPFMEVVCGVETLVKDSVWRSMGRSALSCWNGQNSVIFKLEEGMVQEI